MSFKIRYSKVCTKCHVVKPLTEYWNKKQGKWGKQSQCKVCFYQEVRAWQKKNPDKIRIYNRRYQQKLIRNKQSYQESNE